MNSAHTAPLDVVALGLDWLFSPAVGAVLVLLAAMSACFFLGILLVSAGHRWHPFVMGVAGIVVFATAASRVYLGVHYPSDVAASIV
ncbi:phosphatase PAP2 family protein [Cryobacterium aureum]|uniref:phosphatase PAP2 family protein n=1 Tax=Cryobacterium aureum TaxID=995037 RepID=UPI00101AD4A9|nr:phosphatase PAP2 family protein [Cryobacterium aureum]